MKKPVKVYIYKDNQLIKVTNSQTEAANHTGDSAPTIYSICNGFTRVSKKGYIYSKEPLTEQQLEQRDNLTAKEIRAQMQSQKGEEGELNQIQRQNDDCKVRLGNMLEIPVDCGTHACFHMPRGKEAKKDMLKQFICSKMQVRWQVINKKMALLEQRFIKELIDSL